MNKHAKKKRLRRIRAMEKLLKRKQHEFNVISQEKPLVVEAPPLQEPVQIASPVYEAEQLPPLSKEEFDYYNNLAEPSTLPELPKKVVQKVKENVWQRIIHKIYQ